MTAAGDPAPDPYADALLAARLCAIDPAGLGGIVLRGGGELRDSIVAELRARFPADAPVRRIPTHIDDEALLGGTDIAATLGRGTIVRRPGLFAEAAGGLVVVPMAERMRDAVAGRIAAALDGGDAASRMALVALDDGTEPDERPPAPLAERLAFHIDLSELPAGLGRSAILRAAAGERQPSSGERPNPASRPDQQPLARQDTAPPTRDDLQALVATAVALGVDSARAPLFALRAARAAAALAGRSEIGEDDLRVAARLVLAPRATRAPPPADAPPDEPPPAPETESGDGEDERGDPGRLADVVLAAALASLPPDVLDRLSAGAGRTPAGRARGAGERRRSKLQGRPLGARTGMPRGGARLSLIDTLRAAAPWQALRGRRGARLLVRCEDLRVRRFETRAEACTIFAVDASGSSALARLAEVKGAVELLLADAYVKRAQVALVAFRGTSAELLLPPTRSLARARRSLAELPGGGGTPLAAGLTAARELAETARARGRTPYVVVLTDGRANVALDGGSVRKVAEDDAAAAARAYRVAGIDAAFVDSSPRPRPEAARLAQAMGARYLPLPRADAAAMHAAIVAARPA